MYTQHVKVLDTMEQQDIRLSLPSKGRLAQESLDFLEACALKVYRPNPRQYAAEIPSLPGITVMFQRPGDIVASVRQGTVDFGITGLDVLAEKNGYDRAILTLHDDLGFAQCDLSLAVPDSWETITSLADLGKRAQSLASNGQTIRIATKFPRLTEQYLEKNQVHPFALVHTEGTLEIAPAIGYADLIADLVSSGTTLRDNHLRSLEDGIILRSQACLIGNRSNIQKRPRVLEAALQLLEYIEAHLRAESCYLVLANMRGDSPKAVAEKMSTQTQLSGLQGPTISPVIPAGGPPGNIEWYAVNIVVRKNCLTQAIAQLRAVGGSGVVVSPVTYIFEEEPERCQQLLAALKKA